MSNKIKSLFLTTTYVSKRILSTFQRTISRPVLSKSRIHVYKHRESY